MWEAETSIESAAGRFRTTSMRPYARIVPGSSTPAEDVFTDRPVSESLHPSREVGRVARVQVPMAARKSDTSHSSLVDDQLCPVRGFRPCET